MPERDARSGIFFLDTFLHAPGLISYTAQNAMRHDIAATLLPSVVAHYCVGDDGGAIRG